MPTFVVTAPDGSEYEVDGPEGSTEEQAIAYIQAQQGNMSAPANEEYTVTPDSVTADFSPGQSTPRKIAGRVGKGVAETLAFPAEAALAIPRAGAALAGAETPFLDRVNASDAFKLGFESIGIPTTSEEPSSDTERFFMNAAEAIAGGATGIGAASRAKGVLTETTKRLMEGRLKRFAGEDVLASSGGAALKTVGESGGYDDAASALEFAGNLLTGAAADKVMFRPMDAVKAAKGTPLKIASMREQQREKGFKKAASVVQSAVVEAGEDPLKVADDILSDKSPRGTAPDGTTVGLTAGPRSRSAAVMSMERALLNMENNAAFADQYQKYEGNFNAFVKDSVRQALGGEGVPMDYVEEYLDSSKYIADLAERRIQQTTIDAAREIKSMPPIKDYDYSKEVRKKLDVVYREMDDILKDAWSAVPDAKAVVKDSPLVDALEEIYGSSALTDAPKAAYVRNGKSFDAAGNELPEPNIIKEAKKGEQESNPAALPPSWAKQTILELAKSEKVDAKEVQALRSSLMDAARTARANEQWNLNRRLNKLADGALEVLDKAESDFPEALATARGLTREFKQRFNSDEIATILGKSKRGDDIVPDGETMFKLFQPDEPGRTNIIALKEAFGGKIPAEANNYILSQFNIDAAAEGIIDVRKAEKFRRKYLETLQETELLPIIDKYIEAGRWNDAASNMKAVSSSEYAQSQAAKLVGSYGATGEDLVAGLAAKFSSSNANPAAVISELFGKNNQPTMFVAKTKYAEEGLKTAIAEAAIRSIYTMQGDVSSKAPDTIRRISNALQASGKYTPDQIDRWEQVADAAYRQSQSKKAKIFKGQSNTPQDTMRSKAISELLGGASLKFLEVLPDWAKVKGPGALRFNQKISRLGERVGMAIGANDAQAIINRAILYDPELLAALMKSPTAMNERETRVVRRALKMAAKVAGRAVFGGMAQPSQAQIISNTEEDNGN